MTIWATESFSRKILLHGVICKVMIIPRKPSQITIATDQKQLEKVEYLNSVGSLIANCVIKSRIAMKKATFKKQKEKKKEEE
jgi:hypothetical protein